MSGLRPLEREDLDEVAALYELVMRSGTRRPPAGLASYFERTLLDHPWVDEEIPSFVHVDRDGRIVAFMSSHVRRLRLGDAPLRLACSGQLVADPEARNRAVGALLLRSYLRGPQDLTITDGATDEVRRMWTALGGEPSPLACITWTKPFRPWRYLGDYLLDRGSRNSLKPFARRLLAGPDALTRRATGGLFRPARPATRSEPLTPEALVEHLPSLDRTLRLRPDYDLPFAGWLFGALWEVYGDSLAAALVRDARGRVLGWHVSTVRPGEVAYVLGIAATDTGAGEVVDHLFHMAHERGAVAVQGRLEPRLLEAIGRRRCLLRFTGEALIHARDPLVLGAALTRSALLTRLEGEWWMGHASLPFVGTP